jgi:hypothetical protein
MGEAMPRTHQFRNPVPSILLLALVIIGIAVVVTLFAISSLQSPSSVQQDTQIANAQVHERIVPGTAGAQNAADLAAVERTVPTSTRLLILGSSVGAAVIGVSLVVILGKSLLRRAFFGKNFAIQPLPEHRFYTPSYPTMQTVPVRARAYVDPRRTQTTQAYRHRP